MTHNDILFQITTQRYEKNRKTENEMDKIMQNAPNLQKYAILFAYMKKKLYLCGLI